MEEKLALSNNHGANTGEVLRAASQIVPGDFESWYTEFTFLADQMRVFANSTKSTISARNAHFRASSYYRTADFFLHGNASDPRLTTLWDAMLEDFSAAIKLLPKPAEKIEIQADGFTIPAYFYPAAPESQRGCPGKKPTVLLGSGYDGSQEELYHSIGAEITARGWNFVTYEGPGQPTVRRQQGLGFRPDWWNVVTPVVDYLSNRSDVDMSRLALGGFSFGGTLAPLAASHEHRFAAVLAIDGLWSLQDAIEAQLPAELVAIFNSGNETVFNYVVEEALASPDTPTNFRWLVEQGMWSFATTSPFDWFTRLGEINLDGAVPNITAPVFVGQGQNDDSTRGQPEILAKALGDQGYYYSFRTDLGAGEHCQLGAEAQLSQITLDWLEDIFEKVK